MIQASWADRYVNHWEVRGGGLLVIVGEGSLLILLLEPGAGDASFHRNLVLLSVSGLRGPGLAVTDKVWALVLLNGRPIEDLDMVPIGLRKGYRKQGSWPSH